MVKLYDRSCIGMWKRTILLPFPPLPLPLPLPFCSSNTSRYPILQNGSGQSLPHPYLSMNISKLGIYVVRKLTASKPRIMAPIPWNSSTIWWISEWKLKQLQTWRREAEWVDKWFRSGSSTQHPQRSRWSCKDRLDRLHELWREKWEDKWTMRWRDKRMIRHVIAHFYLSKWHENSILAAQ